MKAQVIPAKQTHDWLLKKHYAHAIPSISYAFGLYVDGVLSGVITYGTPPSPPLRVGIAGEEWKDKVLELNRLVINDDAPENAASFLVGYSLRKLPKPSIVVSYADTEQGHVGYIYQASNFLYTGLSAKRTNWKIDGIDKDPHTIHDMFRGESNRAQKVRDKYGDKFFLVERSRKHRYVYIVADKNDRAKIMADLRYQIEPYPKGDTNRYDAGDNIETQLPLL